MKYLKKFTQHSDYEEFINGGGVELPNVSYCEKENEVHYNPYVNPANGHTYVDLGLPSGTKWATMNIGAEKETDYGLYFAWGETQGYSGITDEKKFSWNDYKYGTGLGNFTKYDQNLDTLELNDNAAYVNWGKEWNIPTRDQIEELLNTKNCTNEWVSDYNESGVNGMLFTSVRNAKKLFIPAAGTCNDSNVSLPNETGFYWSNELYYSEWDNAYNLYFSENEIELMFYGERCIGASIRPVA